MQLTELFDGEAIVVINQAATEGLDINGLTCDSRQVEPGFLFAALPGARADGRTFIDDALRRGAVAVLGPPGTRIDGTGQPVTLLVDDNPRRLFALMAARFFGAQPATIAAVTGTNGKTTVAGFLRQAWEQRGLRAASLGTLGVSVPGVVKAGNLTTPDPVALHEILSNLAGDGVEYLAMEASSHGIDQCRLDGVRLTAIAFTNLTRDHLDYHGSMEAYLTAKLRLFTDVMAPGGQAVVNADTPYREAVLAAATQRSHGVMTYGVEGHEVRLKSIEPVAGGQRLKIVVVGAPHEVKLPLIGAFQASNALCALTLALACGEDAAAAVSTMENLEGIPGRVQFIGHHASGGAVYVDYAHTPDALASLLKALRPHAAGRLVVVFGCGGERDPGKRPEMGHFACDLADSVIVTDDNPREEDAAEIRREVMAGCSGAREIGDRGEAIHAAVAALKSDDLLVIAGKGHEPGQIVGTEVLPFDDASVALEAIGGASA
ncbi:MAG: UDP-N-acetylmuramoyl-L-alanyl-D-glutamate--2,6-diaminopimelate ligase [Rhodospirillales bacterium]|nr:UDP-N-acetylmuramoyl-L-alanyl-D-glutamate--2,6-diaminopimelate ligase [Rhodospirillales bacterium]